MAKLRKESSQAMQESEERLRIALTAARMVAWQIELSTRRMILSSNATDVLGVSSSDTVENGRAKRMSFSILRTLGSIKKSSQMRLKKRRAIFVSTALSGPTIDGLSR